MFKKKSKKTWFDYTIILFGYVLSTIQTMIIISEIRKNRRMIPFSYNREK